MRTQQLAAIVGELEGARERLHRLVTDLPVGRWARRPDPTRWSVAECVAHLNLTSRAYIPLLREALDEGRRAGTAAPGPYRRDVAGWLLSAVLGPLPGIGRFRVGRVRTKPAFIPGGDLEQAEVVADFDRLQEELVALTRGGEGLALGDLRIVSPFDPRLKYNVYSALTLLPRHQHRHLAQAGRAAAS